MDRIPPCLITPEAWDVDPGQRIPIAPVDQLVKACLTRCPAFELCAITARDDAYGVVAGHYRPWPTATALATSFRQTSIQRVMASLRSTIDSAKPGQMLPKAPELARLYGVGETTVRSALLRLAEEGVLIRGELRSQWFRVPDRIEKAA